MQSNAKTRAKIVEYMVENECGDGVRRSVFLVLILRYLAVRHSEPVDRIWKEA